jgi:membrane protein required for colicin V production
MLSELTGWDWFVAIALAVSVGIGLLRGLIRTVFALAAWVTGVLGAPLLGPDAIRALPPEVPHAVTYFVVFLVLFVIVRVLGALAARALHGIGLGGADRLLGAALGVLRAGLVVALVALGAHLAGHSKDPAWKQALTRPLLDALVAWGEPFLPEKLSGVKRT